MTTERCIGEPVSWPRLERVASGLTDDTAADHLTACDACRRCLETIRRDTIALPPLIMPAAAARRWRWWVLAPATLAVTIAIAVLMIHAPTAESARDNAVAIKGIGVVVIDVIRERGGAIRDDVRSFAPGDRWKVIVTCPPAANTTIDVEVTQHGQTTSDRPLPQRRLACGNRVAVPGAFSLTGAQPHQVCARLSSDEGDTGTVCLTLQPE
ncbi:MAG: hypothetical protein AB7O24_26940 [Kofleriaceae bacterium]